MNRHQVLALLKETVHEWNEANVLRLGAAVSFYVIFSLVPLLVIVVAVAGLVLGREAASREVVAGIGDTVGQPVGTAIEDLLRHNADPVGNGLAALVGVVTLLLGASGAFLELQAALNTIWKAEPRAGLGILNSIRDRGMSFLMVLATCFVLLGSLVLTTALAAVGRWMPISQTHRPQLLWHFLDILVAFGATTLLFALIYKLLPDVSIRWGPVWIGASLTAVLFTAAKYLLGIYLGLSGATSVFGAASSLALIILWVYYSAQILLFGAEFTRVYALHHGSGVNSGADTGLSALEGQLPSSNVRAGEPLRQGNGLHRA